MENGLDKKPLDSFAYASNDFSNISNEHFQFKWRRVTQNSIDCHGTCIAVREHNANGKANTVNEVGSEKKPTSNIKNKVKHRKQ